MPSEAPFDLYRDALERAANGLNPDQLRGRYSGVIEELAFAAGKQRLQRLPGGRSAPGRLVLRLKVVSSMLRPMIRLGGGSQPDQ